MFQNQVSRNKFNPNRLQNEAENKHLSLQFSRKIASLTIKSIRTQIRLLPRKSGLLTCSRILLPQKPPDQEKGRPG
jgi:hypothetical protein